MIQVVVMGQRYCYFFVAFVRQITSVHVQPGERIYGRLICVDVVAVVGDIASCHFVVAVVVAVGPSAAEEEVAEEPWRQDSFVHW